MWERGEKRPPLCGPAMKESGLRLRVPTATLLVSSASPVNCWLTTVTAFAPFPVNVMLCALGPKVICAANAPDAHRGGPIARRTTATSLLFMFDYLILELRVCSVPKK